ncbi:MAG TPA: tetratricopeptide repeat protein [Chthonomonadaceae bacterium]|nr:tetratricopeptide repeat protein [Chthonomonadaceae bacterium]
MIQATGQVVPIKINAEKGGGPAIAKKYGVQGYPTILFINGDGEVENKIGGYEDPAPFANDLKDIVQTHKEFPILLARHKDHPNDLETTGKLAVLYAKRGDETKASDLIAEAEKTDPNNSKGYLTKAYNALGDDHQNQGQFDKAIPLFRKAADTGKKPDDVAYARMSIAVCYLQQNKLSEAVPDLKAVAAMPDAPKDLKDQAQAILNQIQKQNANKGSGQ